MNDKIAIYLRLSLADGDLKKGSKDESNSIENQRMLLHDYIGKQEDLFGEIVECDSESVGKVWRIIGWKKLHKKKNTRLGERIDIIFSTRRVFHSAGMCLLEAEGFHPCRQVGFAVI